MKHPYLNLHILRIGALHGELHLDQGLVLDQHEDGAGQLRGAHRPITGDLHVEALLDGDLHWLVRADDVA